MGTTSRSQYLKRIHKRIKHLKSRIADSDIDLTFDKAELSALEWILVREEQFHLQQIQALEQDKKLKALE